MNKYDPLTGKFIWVPPEVDDIVGGGDASNAEYTTCTTEVDGGCANSVYLPEQKIDGGDASG